MRIVVDIIFISKNKLLLRWTNARAQQKKKEYYTVRGLLRSDGDSRSYVFIYHNVVYTAVIVKYVTLREYVWYF